MIRCRARLPLDIAKQEIVKAAGALRVLLLLWRCCWETRMMLWVRAEAQRVGPLTEHDLPV